MTFRVIKMGGVLIGVYLALAYATGAGRLMLAGADGTVKVVKVLQGR